MDVTYAETVLSATNFIERFDRHGAWRREIGLRLKVLGDWMKEQELLDSAVEERIQRLVTQLRSDKVMIAFVAEFSRGKSELINAIFFAHYGRRIMPASAGRTTMCPTELGHEPDLPPCLRLLPIETRLQPQALLEWRMVPDQWSRVELDLDNPEQLAGAMEKVSETRWVGMDEARALGFWHDDRPADNPPVNAAGEVQVPRWRHALINMSHPLLKQGLVILDTPGLNAIGAEPELTVNLIPMAQAVVFILAADTGVTKSDLAMWHEHLSSLEQGASARLVVLNKIDTLWDGLSTPQQIDAQIARQCAETAATLSLDAEQVRAVSAQKGLLAKVRGDDALLRDSRLLELEDLLGRQMLGGRQSMLERSVAIGVAQLKSEAERLIAVRRRELAEQSEELRGLRGKNQDVIRQMRLRIEHEKAEFDRSGASVQAVRSVHMKLLRDVVRVLGSASIKKELAGLTIALREPGIKLGIKAAYATAFENLRGVIRQVQLFENEIHAMLLAAFGQLNTEYGFSLKPAPPPDMNRVEEDLAAVERSHLPYLRVGSVFQLARPEFCDKLRRALVARVRSIFETALGEIEIWNKSSAAQLDAQLRERRKAFARRAEAIGRIQEAAGGLDQRMDEMDEQREALAAVEARLSALTRDLLAPGMAAAAPRAKAPRADTMAPA